MVLRKCLNAGVALLLLIGTAGSAAAWCVRGVDGRDTLRMRAGPAPFAREVGYIPPTACGIAIIGACRGAWCPVQWRGRIGWSNAVYLQRGGLLDFLAMPQRVLPPPPIVLPAPPPPFPARRVAPARQAAVAAAPRRTPPPRAASLRQRGATQRTARAAPPVPQRARAPLPSAPLPARLAPAPAPATAPSPAAPPAAVPTMPSFVPPAAASPAPSPIVAPVPVPATPSTANVSRDACVVEIPKGETLKVRAGPGLDQGLRYGYPAGVCGVRITGPCSNGWCPVDYRGYRGYRGWAEQRFLK